MNLTIHGVAGKVARTRDERTRFTAVRDLPGQGGKFLLYLEWADAGWFSMTGEFDGVSGPIQEKIAQHWPEFSHLLKWHLMGEKGPHYYIENSLYMAERKQWDTLRIIAVWPDVTDETLAAMTRGELVTALDNRLPALIAEFKADINALEFILIKWELA
ncbi:hypothetical protein [Pseudomonas sp.]|uniref:hypothetical protein n=1 Tax=Pseudomonas sp. TaxID=306 RepID=UPI003FD7CB45